MKAVLNELEQQRAKFKAFVAEGSEKEFDRLYSVLENKIKIVLLENKKEVSQSSLQELESNLKAIQAKERKHKYNFQ